MKNILYIFVINLFAISCNKNPIPNEVKGKEKKFTYIQNIQLSETSDSIFIQYTKMQIGFAKNELPLKSAMVVPTSVIAYMDALDISNKITGISQVNYVFNPKVQEEFKNRELEEIGTFNEIFIEKVLVQKPDIFIAQSGPTLAKYYEILQNEGIKIVFIDEYEEFHPLAKAEYLKIIGILFGKEKESEKLFSEIESNYLKIKEKVNSENQEKPQILSNHIYGDIWYMPGGDYLWADTDNKFTLHLSFESVFEKAATADFWMNAGDFSSISEMVASYKNYEWFSALKNKQVYNWSKRSSPTGANDYFETGVVRPDWVLTDLASIFYPNLFPEHELFFYTKLE